MATAADDEEFKNGLRILARMIASAHLREARAREKVVAHAAGEPVAAYEQATARHSRMACTLRAKKAKAVREGP